jgi:hypothetical protein
MMCSLLYGLPVFRHRAVSNIKAYTETRDYTDNTFGGGGGGGSYSIILLPTRVVGGVVPPFQWPLYH